VKYRAVLSSRRKDVLPSEDIPAGLAPEALVLGTEGV
jgi:hypothetical protein